MGVRFVMSLQWLDPMWWLVTAVIVFKAVALADAALRRDDAYRAASKRTKPFWLIILALAFGLDLLLTNSVFGIVVIVGLVAAIVYMVDVRPAIKVLTDGRRGGKGNHMGPYGPW